MIELKVDILQKLKTAGYNTTRIRKEKLLNERTLTELRRGKMPGTKTLDTLCRLLNCQPGSIIRFIPDTAASPAVSPAASPADPSLERYQTEKSEDQHQGTGGNSGTKNPPGA